MSKARAAGAPASGRAASGRGSTGSGSAGSGSAGSGSAGSRSGGNGSAGGRPASGRLGGSGSGGSGPVGDRPARDDPTYYPGERFGLPEDGPRSAGGFGRRLGALLVDWIACEVIALAVFHTHAQVQLWTLLFFAVEVWLLTGLTGFTLGKRLLGIRVARLDGQPVGLFWSLLRTVLLLLIVPPLALDKDLRGLHDKAAGTIVIHA